MHSLIHAPPSPRRNWALTQSFQDDRRYDHLDPVALMIPVPLIVLMRCTPHQLAVWIGLRWLGAVFSEAEQAMRGLSHRQIASLCKVDRRILPHIFQFLLGQDLIYEIGTAKVWRAAGQHQQYGIDVDHVQDVTRQHFSDMLATWQISSPPRRVPVEQMRLFAETSGTSGVRQKETSGTS